MFRRLPTIILFIFVSMIGVCIGAAAGFANELMQRPVSAANALIWLFILFISGTIVTLISLYSRNGSR